MTLFEKFLLNKKPAVSGPPEDPKWSRSAKGHFRRFLTLDPEEEGLTGKGGVFVIWHGGLRPGWVFVGASADLAKEIHDTADIDAILEFEAKGGLFVSWSTIREEFQGGVLRYLNETMSPLVENPTLSKIEDDPIPVILPGQRTKV